MDKDTLTTKLHEAADEELRGEIVNINFLKQYFFKSCRYTDLNTSLCTDKNGRIDTEKYRSGMRKALFEMHKEDNRKKYINDFMYKIKSMQADFEELTGVKL